MRTCQEITEAIEKQEITGVSVSDKVLMRMHFLYCKSCRRYQKDSKILDRMLRLNRVQQPEEHFTKKEIEKIKNHCKAN